MVITSRFWTTPYGAPELIESTERMKIRYNIILAYLSFILWVWIGIELTKSEFDGMVTQIPWWGFLVSAALVYRLECQKRIQNQKSELGSKESTSNRTNEA